MDCQKRSAPIVELSRRDEVSMMHKLTLSDASHNRSHDGSEEVQGLSIVKGALHKLSANLESSKEEFDRLAAEFMKSENERIPKEDIKDLLRDDQLTRGNKFSLFRDPEGLISGISCMDETNRTMIVKLF